MFSEIAKWVGGGIALVILYMVVSNILWLLLGSRLIQSLPCVNIDGYRGTLKIATILVLSAIGLLRWIAKYSLIFLAKKKPLPVLSDEISVSIKSGAKFIKSRNSKQ